MTETELVKRLEGLERDNRRLKGFAVTAIILAAALGAIYATQPVPEVIRARNFEVVDRTGRVRAKMAVQPNGIAFIQVTDELGHARAAMVTSLSGGSTVEILDPKGHQTAGMGDSTLGGSIAVADTQGKTRAVMAVSASGAPSIHLSDAQGFSMDLGRTATENLNTGQTQETSAASIVMFGNDKGHRVIWQAP